MNLKYLTGSTELLDKIQPMWEKLNDHHKAKSEHFANRYHDMTFEKRKSKILCSNILAINIDMVIEPISNNYVGYCVSTVNNEGVGEIDSIYIDIQFRNYGIGDELMKRALTWLDSNNVKSKIIGVAAGNDNVNVFYEKYGFYKRTVILEQVKMEMQFNINEMSENHAKEISAWTYNEPYSIYDGDGSEEFIKELMDGSYFSVVDENDDPIGYYCFGVSAQVPAGKQYQVYDDVGFIDVGLGMRPDLCGKGNGYVFFINGLKFAENEFSSKKFRLTVAAFNERAIKLYEKIGFIKTVTFVRELSDGNTTFLVMELEI